MGRALVIVAAVAVGVLLVGHAAADSPTPVGRYVGAEACGACHARQLESWRATAHARAGASLRESARRRRCQTCHTTGDAPAGRPAFPGVGCEACHGAGAGYATDDVMRDRELAFALGLRDLSTPEARAELCGRCHRAAVRLAPFDAARAWQRIRHDAPR